MSFNIKSSFVSRSVVENNKEKQVGNESGGGGVAPEAYDPRTLYERLQEQRMLKEEQFAEDSRLSNQIKRVSEEEAEYFKILADEKEKLEKQRKTKEKLELEEYRLAVENARSAPSNPLLEEKSVKKKSIFAKPNKLQKNKGVLFVKKKRQESEEEEEEEEAPVEKKTKTTHEEDKAPLSLLSAYGDISSDSESE
ncbi:N-terminal domain of NEFA-interacting nuclear protein NIP30-domain-containing protein [Gilbertella persicaria]|uniref:N-terminal domain of NEFA-interacting nuclear protein NIP30-domain-containing protein n=1 Tax=Gilbertella persicaria TaxID=101096 RepID=UPI00221F59A1|nr:N-terminal domain of NEFA-interacting nuclear protein NIP30-domain-containing protein [Gilbertella persicaria]KAI8091052.1 N-terminal domain of NEFA-interacting nuclear protein NIP30-domain-containing protein [Gilbertella persicaria]